jgi:membrane protease YdiL (CAAX protease family)
MFLPAVSVLIVSSAMNEAPRVRWYHFPLRYLPVALFLIPAVQHAVMLPFMSTAPGGLQWQDWLTPQADGLYHTPASRGWGAVTIQGLVGHIVLNAVVGLTANSFMACFEEIGWRAWLLPRLWDQIGPRRAVVVTAIIWGFWHVPFVSPMRLAATLPFGIMVNGLIIGWRALNNWGQYAFKYMKDSLTPDAVSSDLAALRAGSVALLVVGVSLLWFGIPTQPDREARGLRA